MNEDQQEKLAEYLLGLMERGEDLVFEQAPALIQQILTWKWYVYCTWYCVGIVLVTSFSIWFLSNRKKISEAWGNSCNEPFPWTFPSLVGSILAGTTSLVMVIELSTLFQLWLAPKVYLLEYLAGLAK